MKENIKTTIKKELDWVTMAIPFLIILLLCISFIFLPDSSKHIIESIRTFLGEELGTYYRGAGSFYSLSVSGIFQIWENPSWKGERKTAVFQFRLGIHDIHFRSGCRYSFLFTL